MKSLFFFFLIVLNLLSLKGMPTSGWTIDFDDANLIAGERLATTQCAACHGPKGISTNPQWPNLYGQKAFYLYQQLDAYKSGSRIDPLMTPFAQSLSKKNMRDVSAYYAQFPLLPPSGKIPDKGSE